MQNNIKKESIIHYILIYFLIACGGSAWNSFLGENFFIIISVIIPIVYFLLIKKGRFFLNRKYAILIISLVFSCFFTICYSSLSFGSCVNLISKFLLVYCVIDYNKYEFINRYINVSVFLTAISIILFVLTQVVGFDNMSWLFSKLFVTYDSSDRITSPYGYGLIFYRWIPLHSSRNCGMFGEPGKFAVMLSFSLFLTITYNEVLPVKQRTRVILILIIGLITCQSTSGYLCLICFILAGLYMGKAFLKSKVAKNLIIIGAALLLVFNKQVLQFIDVNFINKIFSNGNLNLNQGTASARTGSITDILEYIFDNPFSVFGIGYDTLQRNQLGDCAGILTLLITFGIFTFIIIYGFITIHSLNKNKSILFWLLFMSITIVIGLSQPNNLFQVAIIYPIYRLFNVNHDIQGRVSIYEPSIEN